MVGSTKIELVSICETSSLSFPHSFTYYNSKENMETLKKGGEQNTEILIMFIVHII